MRNVECGKKCFPRKFREKHLISLNYYLLFKLRFLQIYNQYVQIEIYIFIYSELRIPHSELNELFRITNSEFRIK